VPARARPSLRWSGLSLYRHLSHLRHQPYLPPATSATPVRVRRVVRKSGICDGSCPGTQMLVAEAHVIPQVSASPASLKSSRPISPARSRSPDGVRRINGTWVRFLCGEPRPWGVWFLRGVRYQPRPPGPCRLPQQCHIAVVLTTATSHCRGCRRPMPGDGREIWGWCVRRGWREDPGPGAQQPLGPHPKEPRPWSIVRVADGVSGRRGQRSGGGAGRRPRRRGRRSGCRPSGCAVGKSHGVRSLKTPSGRRSRF
jgi:hypothetical protein